MTSLPTSAAWNEPQARSTLGAATIPIGRRSGEDEQFLLKAFRSFADAAASLKFSYAELRREVERLQRELAVSNGELARTAQENARMRAHLDRILQDLPCGVLVTSAEGHILRANPEALRIIAKRLDETELSISELTAPVQKLLQLSRQAKGELETEIGAEPSVVRWLAARHAALQEGGDADIFILRDVTERKRMDEIGARFERDLELASVATLLAHEIRNPLGSLELFAGLLMESDLDPEQRRWVEHVQAGVRMLSATVNNVLQYHTLPTLESTPVELGQMLEWARDFVAPLARQSGTTLSLENGLSGVMLFADRHRLEQVFLNLILNSFHFAPEGGWVQLSGRRGTGDMTAIIEVADTGPGIPDENLNEIFEPGFSLRPGSPGLGLALCRRIVEQHGGQICARNRAGNGAIFTVTLPLSGTREGPEN